MKKFLAIPSFLLLTLLWLTSMPAHSAKVDLSPFYGKVPGKKIELKPYRDGFVIEFENQKENIVFLPHGLKGHFLARSSGEVLQGEKYLWAVVKHQILKIHVFKFDENGNYKISSFCYDCQGPESLENLFPYSLEESPSTKAQASVDTKLQDFFGTYVGHAKEVSKNTEKIFPNRDVELIVNPFRRGRGFEIKWVTVIYKNKRTDPSVKRRANQAKFVPSCIPSLYEPFYKKNPFKITRKVDLLLGDQLSWARLLGKHLTIYTLQITNDGEYVLKSYDRELTENGSNIIFTSFIDGIKSREVIGELTKVKPDL